MRTFLLLISLFLFQDLYAQVKGVIIDSASKNPLDRAVVGIIVKSNISDTSYTITNEKGEFSFDQVPSSSFSVFITNIGYRPVAKFIQLSSKQKTVDIGLVTLTSVTKVLNEVFVESPPITVKEDTIEYRADAFKVKDNAVVEDLLKKMPGIQVDKDGNIKAQGKNVTKVKVNGKDFFGGDPKTATKELPANIVDKVQIIDDYGDQATVSGIKEGDPEKVMNIQLKKDKNTGYFGRVTAGAGDQGRYQASFNGNYFNNTQQISLFSNSNNTNQSLFSFGGGNMGMGNMIKTAKTTVDNMGGTGSLMNAFSNGDQGFFQNGSSGSDGITTTNSIGLNYRDDWSKQVSAYGSYSYGHHNTTGYKTVSQQNIFQNKTFLNDQDNQFENAGDNHRFFFNVEYNIDSFNYIKISPSINYGTSDGSNKTVFDYFTDSTGKTSEGYNNNTRNSTSPNISVTILFNHRFNRRGRNFSVNFSTGRSENTSDQETENSTTQFLAPAGKVLRFTSNRQLNKNHYYGIRLTYSEPLSKTRALDFAFSHNFSFSGSNKITNDINPITGTQTFNSSLSNNYENNYVTERAMVSLRTTEKKYNYTLGLSIQPVDLKGMSVTKDSLYTPIRRVNIFPVARFAYNFSRSKSLTASYRGDAQQPTFSQLQDVLDVSNPQYLTKGNPQLKPSLNHSINLFYNNFNFVNGRVLFTNLVFNTIQNQIIYNVVPVGSSGAQLSVPENVNGYYNATGFYSYSRPYKNRRYIISLNGNINYNHNVNLTDSLRSIGKNWVIGQGLNFEFNYKEWLEFATGANYTLNSVKYSNTGKSNSLQNQQYSSWMINSNISIDLPKNWVIKSDFEYAINNGLTGSVGKNMAILNASVEKQLFKKKNGQIRFQGFDLFDQNSNISRTVSSNSIIDSRSNRLTRYFMLTFTYRLQKFKGKQQPPKNLVNPMQMHVGN